MIAIVLGGSGMLGQSFVSTIVRAGAQVLAPGHKELDITNQISVRKYITTHRPNFVINCVAYTDVDGCEKDPAKAHLINAEAVDFAATAAKKVKAKFVQISTDYVFDGTTTVPYSEEDPVHPIQVYGQSKLCGEQRAIDNGGTVFRVQWLFGQGKSNFIDWVGKSIVDGKKIPIAAPQVGSPCSTMFVSNLICVALHLCQKGIYHVAHDNYANRLECAHYIADYFKRSYQDHFQVMDNVGFGIAPRPVNTSLSAEKLRRLMGLHTLGQWQTDVMTYLSSRFNVWSQ